MKYLFDFKKCRECQIEKPIGHFYEHPEMSDGHLNQCKECKKSSSRKKWELDKGPSKLSPVHAPDLMPKELIVWIPDLEGKYAITNMGRAFSYTKNWGTKTGIKNMKMKERNNGYLEINVSINNGKTDILIHRAVLFSFVGPPENPKSETRHLNGNRKDNRLKNLRWGTSRENTMDAKKHGTLIIGEKQWNSSLTKEKVIDIRQKYDCTDMTYKEISDTYNVSEDTIAKICRGESWEHVEGPIQERTRQDSW